MSDCSIPVQNNILLICFPSSSLNHGVLHFFSNKIGTLEKRSMAYLTVQMHWLVTIKDNRIMVFIRN